MGAPRPGGPGRLQDQRRRQQQRQQGKQPGKRQQQPGKQRPAPLPEPRGRDKKKVNCKPKNQDEQEIPFRLREIMRSREEMKKPLSSKKRKAEAQVAFQKTVEEAKGAEPDIAVPKFKQRKWESERAYVRRMEQETQHVLFLTKNQGERQPEMQAAPKQKSERKKAFQKRRLDKIRRRKEEKAAERLERELLRDPVQFGEVALQPPELTAKPRTSAIRDQPGSRSLVLQGLLSPLARPQSASLARQRIVGEERARVVQAYRALRQRQQKQRTLSPPSPPAERTPSTHL
ncbi:Coiled-coil domain-containing protein 137 [Galemys pyrenaicus]|uniref:Coiled-coil domain-containing protein 137 n=1 Tax=Galemys pyrenaicus TaxID=202257 RepID=A0A8J5ZMN4_GALPY|nr:Coiled-coil domain-containing protein 137 [Galemys pyrenaicus]